VLTIRVQAFNMEGRARVMYDLAGFELRRHRVVMHALERVLDTVRLTEEEARELIGELKMRRLLVDEAKRQRRAAYNVAWVEQHRARCAAARGA
jgi:hypothetical protein